MSRLLVRYAEYGIRFVSGPAVGRDVSLQVGNERRAWARVRVGDLYIGILPRFIPALNRPRQIIGSHFLLCIHGCHYFIATYFQSQ